MVALAGPERSLADRASARRVGFSTGSTLGASARIGRAEVVARSGLPGLSLGLQSVGRWPCGGRLPPSSSGGSTPWPGARAPGRSRAPSPTPPAGPSAPRRRVPAARWRLPEAVEDAWVLRRAGGSPASGGRRPGPAPPRPSAGGRGTGSSRSRSGSTASSRWKASAASGLLPVPMRARPSRLQTVVSLGSSSVAFCSSGRAAAGVLAAQVGDPHEQAGGRAVAALEQPVDQGLAAQRTRCGAGARCRGGSSRGGPRRGRPRAARAGPPRARPAPCCSSQSARRRRAAVFFGVGGHHLLQLSRGLLDQRRLVEGEGEVEADRGCFGSTSRAQPVLAAPRPRSGPAGRRRPPGSSGRRSVRAPAARAARYDSMAPRMSPPRCCSTPRAKNSSAEGGARGGVWARAARRDEQGQGDRGSRAEGVIGARVGLIRRR